jgi:hypothetical protein
MKKPLVCGILCTQNNKNMIITHHGAEFFKVSFGDTTLAFNPISKNSKLKQTRFGADIALISLEHSDMNGAEQLAHGEKEPYVVRGPGEYEVQDVLIKGYPTKSLYGGFELINTAYLVTFEKMLILFLGATSTRDLPKELKETLDNIDILFIPIGGEGVLEAKKAYELAVSISPHIIVPMHFEGVGEKDALTKFLKEEGSSGDNHAPISKLTVKTKDLEDKQNEIVIISS